jgi:hypothetical protein
MDRSRHVWSYSVFAGICAGVLETTWVGLSREKLTDPASITFILVVALCAFIAARIAGTLATRAQRSDHGLLAGCATWPIFSLIVGVVFVMRGYFAPSPFSRPWSGTWAHILITMVGGILAVFISSSYVALPACLLGTAVFNAGLRVCNTARRAFSRRDFGLGP